MNTEMTPQQYADLRGIYVTHVQRYCKDSKPLDGVMMVKKFGRQYVLVVDNSYIEKMKKINISK